MIAVRLHPPRAPLARPWPRGACLCGAVTFRYLCGRCRALWELCAAMLAGGRRRCAHEWRGLDKRRRDPRCPASAIPHSPYCVTHARRRLDAGRELLPLAVRQLALVTQPPARGAA